MYRKKTETHKEWRKKNTGGSERRTSIILPDGLKGSALATTATEADTYSGQFITYINFLTFVFKKKI